VSLKYQDLSKPHRGEDARGNPLDLAGSNHLRRDKIAMMTGLSKRDQFIFSVDSFWRSPP
jgi:hypothetical protein